MMQTQKYKDYSGFSLNFRCFRKHFLKDRHYYLYLSDDLIIICEIPLDPKPKYEFIVSLSKSIEWVFKPEQQDFGFGLEYEQTVRYFSTNETTILQMRKALAAKIMFKTISVFYLAIKLLEKGSSSQVFLIQDRKTQKYYASKCIDKQYLLEDLQGVSSLQQEIRYMTQLKHPNLIQLYEVYQGESTYYLIIDYLEGKSLHELINQVNGVGFQLKQIKIIMKQLLEGIGYMHSQNLMHRDIKPENIMFSIKGDIQTLKIVDYGLVTNCNVKMLSYAKCGTPGYVAPEVANLTDPTMVYDKVCDIFSLGVILYKMFTLRDLFPGKDFEEVLKQNKACRFNLTLLSIYKTPKVAQDLISQMLQVDPQRRISAQDALAHEFFTAQEEPPRQIDSCNKLLQQKQKSFQQTKQRWQTADLVLDRNFEESDFQIEEEQQTQVRKPPALQPRIMLHRVQSQRGSPMLQKGKQRTVVHQFQYNVTAIENNCIVEADEDK